MSFDNNTNSDFQFDFTPILGWSVSRFDMFQICKRKYYYHYYNKYDKEYPIYKIRELKNLTSIPLITGTIVHEVIKELLHRLLTTEEKINRFKFFYFARKKSEEICKKSSFAEMYYSKISKIDFDKIYSNVRLCLKNFLDSSRFKWLTGKAVRNKGDWIIEPPGFGETRINDLKAYAKVDFLFPIDDQIIIIDWKSGQPRKEKHKKQLMGYITWASYHFNTAPDNVTSFIAYLKPEYSEIQIPTNTFDLRVYYEQVKSETRKMFDYCRNIEKNIPLEKKAFIKTSNKRICEYCNFRELCQ